MKLKTSIISGYSLNVQLQSNNQKRATVNPLSSMSKDLYLFLPGGRIEIFPESGSLCRVEFNGGDREGSYCKLGKNRKKRGRKRKKRERERERERERKRDKHRLWENAASRQSCKKPEAENLFVTTIALNLDTPRTTCGDFHYRPWRVSL